MAYEVSTNSEGLIVSLSLTTYTFIIFVNS